MPAYCVYELIRPTILYLAAPRYGENSVNTLFVHVISVSGESETISHIFWINEQAGNVVSERTIQRWKKDGDVERGAAKRK